MIVYDQLTADCQFNVLEFMILKETKQKQKNGREAPLKKRVLEGF